jgi:hypothetical protein
MVLVDIDTLSEAELRDIAQQLDVEDWESLSKEDLIEAIEDNYDDEIVSDRLSGGASSGHRYIKMMTKTEHEGSFGFPGVEDLPLSYNETSICFLLKDANWAYVFWNISPNTRGELEQNNATLLVRIDVIGKNGEKEDSFDIGITKEDEDWNVELPWRGKQYRAVLVAISGKEEEILAQSNTIGVHESWLDKHLEVLDDPARFNLLFASLVTKGGSVINNRQVRELLDMYKNTDAEA